MPFIVLFLTAFNCLVALGQKNCLSESESRVLLAEKLYKNCSNCFQRTKSVDSTRFCTDKIKYLSAVDSFLCVYSINKSEVFNDQKTAEKYILRFEEIPIPTLDIRVLNKKVFIQARYENSFLLLPSIAAYEFGIRRIGKIELKIGSNKKRKTIFNHNPSVGVDVDNLNLGDKLTVKVTDLYRVNIFNEIIKMPLILEKSMIFK